MLIHKIILRGGQIEIRQEIDNGNVDTNLLSRAQDVLADLRSGIASISNPIPDGPELTVSLGLPRSEYLEHHLREQWQALHPGVALSEYESMRGEVTEHLQRTGFYLMYKGVTDFYHLVLRESTEEDAGLYGTVAGSSLEVEDTPVEEQTAEERANYQQQHESVVREMIALKPAFIAPSMRLDPRSLFGDHFAVAMLLSDAG
jgi:hypothetical protein